ncbi:hypothetical protein EYF80_052467 [Liparis tanakae]|uniref:Uncharacterized protein n=1 Tax=Liparis tanakae TaxID=230148 RepID=A0A4Z2F930_9TELE|nr:hypothetical protein EYF80_052467 [Liparis tanakae]
MIPDTLKDFSFSGREEKERRESSQRQKGKRRGGGLREQLLGNNYNGSQHFTPGNAFLTSSWSDCSHCVCWAQRIVVSGPEGPIRVLLSGGGLREDCAVLKPGHGDFFGVEALHVTVKIAIRGLLALYIVGRLNDLPVSGPGEHDRRRPTVHSYTPCSSRAARRTVREKTPLTKSPPAQLKPSFICVSASPKEATSEPLLIQRTLRRERLADGGSVTLQGRVAFVFGLAWISLGDALRVENKGVMFRARAHDAVAHVQMSVNPGQTRVKRTELQSCRAAELQSCRAGELESCRAHLHKQLMQLPEL